MAIQITDELKAKAQVFYGDDVGKYRTKVLLREVGLPTGLLPLKDIIECGYVEETGFVWLKQKKKIEHKFESIGKWVSYGVDVQAYAERKKIKKLVGVKAKELLVWITLSEIFIDDSKKITFKAPSGLFKTFPASAFESEDDFKEEGETKEEEKTKEVKEEAKELKEEAKEVKEAICKETKPVEEVKEVKEALKA